MEDAAGLKTVELYVFQVLLHISWSASYVMSRKFDLDALKVDRLYLPVVSAASLVCGFTWLATNWVQNT